MPDILPLLIVIVLGVSFGSFITLASWRLPRDEEIVVTPSRCTACGTRLTARDLLPLVSWLRSGGACRHCGAAVHWRYPAIELVTGGVFALIYLHYGITLQALALALFAVALLIMIVVDFEHYLIPDEVHFALAPLGIAWLWLTHAPWQDALSGAALGAAIGLGLHYGYQWLKKRDGLGFGDVKLFTVAGLWLGLKALVPFFCFSGLLGVATALLWRALGKGRMFPFGPALAVALFLLVVFPQTGDAFWHWPRALLKLDNAHE